MHFSKNQLNTVYVVFEQIFLRLVNFGTFILIAQYSPIADLGAIGLAWSICFLVESFCGTGLMAAYVQNRRTNLVFRSTFFWLGIIAGGTCFSLITLSSLFVGKVLDRPDLVGLASGLGLVLLIRFASLAHRGTHLRDERLGILSAASAIAATIGAGVGIYFAVHGHGVWSLIYRNIVVTVIESMIVVLRKSWLPAFRVNRRIVKEVIIFARPLAIAQASTISVIHLKQFILTATMGLSGVGRYVVASKIPDIGAQSARLMIGRLVTPRISAATRNGDPIRDTYDTINWIVWIGGALVVAASFLMKDLLMERLFGENGKGLGMVFFLLTGSTMLIVSISLKEAFLIAIGYPAAALVAIRIEVLLLPLWVVAAFISLEVVALIHVVSKLIAVAALIRLTKQQIINFEASRTAPV